MFFRTSANARRSVIRFLRGSIVPTNRMKTSSIPRRGRVCSVSLGSKRTKVVPWRVRRHRNLRPGRIFKCSETSLFTNSVAVMIFVAQRAISGKR